MGNTKLWKGSPEPADGLAEEVFESSSASDLQSRVRAHYASLIEAGRGLLDLSLSGAGDGHAFMCTMLSSPVLTDPELEFWFYSAANEPSLRSAAAAVIAGLQGPPTRYVYGQAEAGSKQGTRFIGVLLVSISD